MDAYVIVRKKEEVIPLSLPSSSRGPRNIQGPSQGAHAHGSPRPMGIAAIKGSASGDSLRRLVRQNTRQRLLEEQAKKFAEVTGGHSRISTAGSTDLNVMDRSQPSPRPFVVQEKQSPENQDVD